MAKIAEAFMMKVTTGLDEALAKLDHKIADFTAVETPQNEKLLSDIGSMHHHIEELHDEIQGLLNEKEKRKEAEKKKQDEYDRDHLFKSTISTNNPKTIHELYEEMDLLDIDSESDDGDSGNEMDDEGGTAGEDEVIFLGKIDQPTRQKRSANEARLTPPGPLSRPAGRSEAGTVEKTASPAVSAAPVGSSQKAPAAVPSTPELPQAPSIPSAHEPPKAPLASQVPIGQAMSTSSRSRVAPTVPGITTKSMVIQGTPVTIVQQDGASKSVLLPPGVLTGQMQGSSKTIVLPASMLPGPKNLPLSKMPLNYRMVTIARGEGGRELKSVKQMVLENPHGVPVDGKVVLKLQEGPQQQLVQVNQFGQPLKMQDASKATPSSSTATIPLDDEDDDDIVMLGSTPATGVAKKSTTLRATARAPSALPGQGGSPGKVRQGVQLIHGGDYDTHLMEGEEIMFTDDDATLPELVEGKKVLAKGEESFWFLGTLIGPPIHHKGMKKYKVRFEHGRKRLLSSKFLAVVMPSKPGDLAVGIRVVASYLVEDGAKTKGMYAGIIAEVPMKTNKGRYLVFFDDGYAQYLSCNKIHIVYHSSACVWADVDIFSRDFIREYLDKYPDRSMVNLKKDQVVTTEWNGKWWNARVLEVQGSLVNMLFEATASREAETEWIYRGSTRLKPLLDLGDKKNAGVTTGPTPEQLRLNLPYVELTKVHSDHILSEQQIPQPKPTMLGRLNNPQGSGAPMYPTSQLLQQFAQQSSGPVMSFAKKSTGSVISGGGYYDTSSSEHKKKKKKKKNKDRRKEKYEDKEFEPQTSTTPTRKDRLRPKRYEEDKLFEPETRVNLPAQKERLRYIPHICNPTCLGPIPQVVDPTQNCLLWPMDLGWVRELCKQGSNKRYVIYRTPCGKSLYSFDDIRRYFRETQCTVLSVDRFSFDSYVHISFNPRRTRQNSRFYYMQLNDLSKGVEKVPVSCVNEYDTDEPPPLVYMTERQPGLRGSKVNTDPNFLTCCDCTDDCADASKCACRQLTIEASTSNHDGKPRPNAGYKDRLLFDQIQTGIYECNDRCKCSKQCGNKVVQHGLSLRLQVFKTYDRGWGIRCLDDIPKGMFVCTYAGQIWDEEEANQKGKDHGDEYFAELDYIEIVERMKEGYESDVDPIDEDMPEKDSDEDSVDNNQTQSSSDDDFQTAASELSSDDSADIINPVPKQHTEEVKESTNQKEQAGGNSGTKLVLRRQSESTEDSQWSVSLANPNGKKGMVTPPRVGVPTGPSEVKSEDKKALTMKYGYDPSPSKDILDQKQIAAFRQRRAKHSSGGNNDAKSQAKSSGADTADDDDDDIQILTATPPDSGTVDEKKPSNLMETDGKPDASVSKSLQELDLKDDKGGIKNEDDDKEKKPLKPKVTGPRARKSTNSRMRQRYKGSPGTSAEPIAEKKETEEEEEEKKSSHPNTRSLFGEKHCYVMDAKLKGNLGRYLNHSCRPNLFVQNVFVDSHDLRFPWVAFFAAQYIRAGSELNWDYMYEVGCVPGKEIICLCKNAECRGRLL